MPVVDQSNKRMHFQIDREIIDGAMDTGVWPWRFRAQSVRSREPTTANHLSQSVIPREHLALESIPPNDESTRVGRDPIKSRGRLNRAVFEVSGQICLFDAMKASQFNNDKQHSETRYLKHQVPRIGCGASKRA